VPGGVQFQGTGGTSQAASGDALPLTTDGDATWMHVRTGNGVFQTGVVTSSGSARIDTGSVTDPSAITNSTYTIQFSVAGSGSSATTTYSVLKDGNPTAQSNVAYTAGHAIQVDGMSFTIDGQPANGDAFQTTPSTPTMSVFDALDQAITNLKTPARSTTKIAQANVLDLNNVDRALTQVSNSRSAIGTAMNRIDSVTNRLSDLKLASQTERSNAEDVDMTKAISDFSNQQTGYDAALKAYSMVQKLSLFNYLGN